MNIEYCQTCGLRIRDADFESGAALRTQEGVAFCPQCRPVRGKSSAHRLASVSETSPLPRSVSSGHLRDNRTDAGPAHSKSAHQHAQAPVPRAIPPKVLIGGSVGVVVLLIIVVVLLNSGSTPPVKRALATKPSANLPVVSGSPAIPPVVAGPDTTKTPDTSKTGASSTQLGPAKTDSMEDMRESWARRVWDELRTNMDRNPGALWATQKGIRDFVGTYGSTTAGKEAAEFLKSKSIELPPAPTPERTLAELRADFTPEKPKAGWAYLWNADGEIGRAANYKPLVWNSKAGMYTGDANNYPALGTAYNYVRMAHDGGHPGTGVDQKESGGFDRYLIAAYRIQPAQAGKTAITGRVTCNAKDGGVEIRLYVNDMSNGSAVVRGGTSVDFSTWLGDLKEGDTIYVAVGPNRNDGNDTFGLTMVIHR